MTSPTDRKIYQGSVQPKSFPSLPSDWTSEWETFPSSEGKLQLFSVIHHPKSWTSAKTLVVLHGLGEHGGRYLHFPHYLQNEVGAVYSLDHRGHGRSEGLRGHVERFDALADDAALAISRLDESLKKRFGKSEIHILGHSLGGLILLRALFLHPHLPLSSATVSAPLLKVKSPLPAYKKVAAHILSRFWGWLHMTSELDATRLTHDQEVVEAYLSDRLVHQKGTPRFYTEMVSALADTARRDSGIQVPLQMLIPMQDAIVDPEAALQFFKALKLSDKLLKTYSNFYHEPFNEIGKEQVFADLALWIKSHSTN